MTARGKRFFQLLAVAIAASSSACSTPGAGDVVAIYSAALDAPGMLRRGRGFALDRYLMSDSGTFEASGTLSSAVVEYLKNHGTVQEVCTVGRIGDHVPVCEPNSAGTELRLSRPIPLGDTAVAVFVAQLSMKTKGDTSSLPIEFATAHRCLIARDKGAWLLRRCDLHMIT